MRIVNQMMVSAIKQTNKQIKAGEEGTEARLVGLVHCNELGRKAFVRLLEVTWHVRRSRPLQQ